MDQNVHANGLIRSAAEMPGMSGAVASRSPGASPNPPAIKPSAPYPPPAALPTQSGPAGIRFDFNLGARLLLPAREAGTWRVVLRDLDTGNILYISENQGALINSSKRWFARFRLEVEDGSDARWSHEFDARGREMLIQFPIGTLGDTLAWMPSTARFAAAHGCRVTCAMSGLIIPPLVNAYPDIQFVTHEELIVRATRARLASSNVPG